MKSIVIALTLAVLVMLGMSISPSRGQADEDTILIVVNSRVSDDALSVAEVRRLFLKERSAFKDGQKAVPVNAKSGSNLRKVFARKVLGMTEAPEKTYWQEQKIKKGTTSPPEFNNTQKAVFSLNGGIGYCFKSDHFPSVNKVILSL